MRSLDRQLPLAAFALLTVVAASITWAAYRHARATTLDLFGERLTRVTDQLAATVGPGVVRGREALAQAAEEPEIIQLLAGTEPSSPDSAIAVLARTVPRAADNVVVGIWNLSGDLVAGIGADTADWVTAPPLVDQPTTTPLTDGGSVPVHYSTVAPVRDGRRLVGFLQVTQQIGAGGGGNGALLGALIGETGKVLLGSPGGAWTDLSGKTEPPPDDVVSAGGVMDYRRAGTEVLGVGRMIQGTNVAIVAEVSEAAALAGTRSFLVRVGLVAALLVTLATVAAWILARRITIPLAQLREAAEGLAAEEYDRRAPERGHPEIVSVARTFNKMAAETEGHVRALQQSEQRFRSLVTASAQIVWWTDAEGNMTEPLPSWQAYTGATFEEIRGAGWTGALHPDDAANALRVWKEAVQNQSFYETEYRIRRHDGQYRWFVARGVPILDRDGTTREWVGTCTDITKRRDTEETLRKKEMELQSAQRLDAVGRLAGGIAHDFNNLLTAILGPAELATAQLPEGHPVRDDLHDIRVAARRASDLTRKLLAFGRQQVMAPVVLDVNEAVRSASQLLSRVIGELVRLEVTLNAAAATVKVDRTHFEQIIVNLAVNARDAMPEGGRLTIETHDAEIDASMADKHHDLTPGRYVLVAVSDTGTGIDAETQKQIFEPFFTTKGQEKGTGLGLSTVYGIIRQSRGHIYVYSEVGQGTTFKIYLPYVDAAASDEAPLPTRDADLPRGSETILLTEDEASIRALGSRMLTQLGYTVLPAANGTEATQLAASHGGDIHLLLSDVVMPGMNGIELWERLRLERPALPALFVSGWASEAVVNHGILDGQVPFLQKPFSVHQLAAKVRDVLDAAAARATG
jgi:PAS domain S-box-containing protein